MSAPGDGDTGRVSAHKRTMRFVYEHSVTLVAVSVAWFVASLPLVTVGPATLGAYAAIRSLRETGALDRGHVVGVLRRNGVHAALLSFLPVTFFVAAGLYVRGGTPRTGFETVIAVVGVYVGAYLVVALIPTFVAMAAGAAGIAAYDTVVLDLDDEERLREEAVTARTLGYDGKAAVAPEQVEVINEVFTPSEEEVSRARRLIEAFESAGEGTGLVEFEGTLVDKPVVDQQRALLARARAVDGTTDADAGAEGEE